MTIYVHARLLLFAGLVVAAVTPAQAASFNYIFPDGTGGFALTSQGGVVNPGIIVGFNPQPDPPAFGPTFITLENPASPRLVSPGPCSGDVCVSTYGLVVSFLGIGNPALSLPPVPDSHGNTGLAFTIGSGDFAHHFIFALNVSGPTSIASWVAFNPQPDPPADWFGVQVGFATGGDPEASFTLFEDGVPLQFELAPTPLPAGLPLFGTGLGVIGLLARRKWKRAAALVA